MTALSILVQAEHLFPAQTMDIVLVGGGHAHVYTIKMIGMLLPAHARVTLISKDVDTPYSGMIPGHVAGVYSREECHIDLHRLCSYSNVSMIHAEVCKIDTKRRLVFTTDGRPPLAYDALSLDIGISPKPVEGVNMKRPELCLTPVKPIDSFALRWDVIRKRAQAWAPSQTSAAFRVAVVGGGAGGVELCLAMYDRLLEDMGSGPEKLDFKILQRGDRLLTGHNKGVRRLVGAALSTRGIAVFCNEEVNGVEFDEASGEKVFKTISGSRYSYDEAVWCTHACGQSWVANTGLAVTEDGCVKVSDTLQSTNTPNVFACGDICEVQGHWRPKAGVFAVRAGPPLTRNIVNYVLKQPLESWHPQDQFLGILRTGKTSAVASRGPLAIEGEYLWTLKDHIDRKFMDMYNITDADEKPMMPMMTTDDKVDTIKAQDLVHMPEMRCGGCGSKVGSTVLTRVLRRLKKWADKEGHPSVDSRPDIVAGIGDDAAVTIPPDPSSHRIVQTVDFFRSFIADPFLFGKIAAQHALSDCFAMNAKPLTAMALCTVPFAPNNATEQLLLQMLAGATSVLAKSGCALVGGHTCEAADTSLGFAITGSVATSDILPKGPILVGQSLILTKALGTGALFAADMRARAKGKWIYGAKASMLLSNQDPARIVKSFGCTACTDVTGFGLIGHLIEMMQFGGNNYEEGRDEVGDNSEEYGDGDIDEFMTQCELQAPKVTAVSYLHIDKIPILAGAELCVDSGITSSLHPDNLRSARTVKEASNCMRRFGAKYHIMFDPQTAGGLLCSVPNNRAPAVIAALHASGYSDAAIIGEVRAASPQDRHMVHFV